MFFLHFRNLFFLNLICLKNLLKCHLSKGHGHSSVYPSGPDSDDGILNNLGEEFSKKIFRDLGVALVSIQTSWDIMLRKPLLVVLVWKLIASHQSCWGSVLAPLNTSCVHLDKLLNSLWFSVSSPVKWCTMVKTKWKSIGENIMKTRNIEERRVIRIILNTVSVARLGCFHLIWIILDMLFLKLKAEFNKCCHFAIWKALIFWRWAVSWELLECSSHPPLRFWVMKHRNRYREEWGKHRSHCVTDWCPYLTRYNHAGTSYFEV